MERTRRKRRSAVVLHSSFIVNLPIAQRRRSGALVQNQSFGRINTRAAAGVKICSANAHAVAALLERLVVEPEIPPATADYSHSVGRQVVASMTGDRRRAAVPAPASGFQQRARAHEISCGASRFRDVANSMLLSRAAVRPYLSAVNLFPWPFAAASRRATERIDLKWSEMIDASVCCTRSRG